MLDELARRIREGLERIRALLDPSGGLKPQPVPVPVSVDPRQR